MLQEKCLIKNFWIGLKNARCNDYNEISRPRPKANKIVGKAVAMLFVMAGIKEVYAEVLSVSGKAFLEQNNINVSWGVLTDVIINRQGTGMCPMEKAVLNINDCREAFKVLMH